MRKCQIHEKSQKHEKSQNMKSQNEAKAMKKSQDQTRPKTKQIFFSVPHTNHPGNAPGKGASPLSCRACIYSPYAASL